MEGLFSKPLVRVIIALVCIALWGTAYPLIKLGYSEMNISAVSDRIMFAGVRYIIAGLMVFLVLIIFKRDKLIIHKSKISIVVIYGLVQTGLMYLFNYIGVANTSATKTSVLTSLSAFIAVLAAPIFFKNEKLTVIKIIGCALGFLGVVIVNTKFFDGSFSLTGEGFIIISMFLSAAGGFIGKKAGEGNPFGVSAFQLSIGGIFLIIISIIFGGCIHFSINGLLITLFLAFVSAVSFSLWTLLLVYNDAGKVMVFNLLIPVFGSIFSFIILGEKEMFSLVYIVSIVLVSTGVLLVNLENNK